MMAGTLSLLFILALYGGLQAAEPGLRIRVSQKGMDYTTKVAVELFMKEIPNIRIPDIRQKVGPVELTVSNIRVRSFPRPSAAIRPRIGSGLRWTLSRLSPVITASYHARGKVLFWTINKYGTATITGSQLTYVLDFFVGRDRNKGTPTISATSCSNQGGTVRLSFRGGMDGILNLGSSLLRKRIQSLVNAQICNQARKEINSKASYSLSRVKMTETVEDDFKIDFHLVKWPTFTSNYVELGHKGLIFLDGKKSEPPFQPSTIPSFSTHTSRMLYIYVTDYVINSGFYAAYHNRILMINVTAAMLPADHRKYLDTTCAGLAFCIGAIFPKLSQEHPNSRVELTAYADAAPSVSVDGKLIHLRASGNADFYASGDSKRSRLFSLNIAVNSSLEISVVGRTIKFKVKSISQNAKLTNSTIGSIGSNSVFNFLLRLAIQNYLLPRLNEIGEKGFPVPELKDVVLVKPQVIQGAKNVLVVATDVDYTKVSV